MLKGIEKNFQQNYSHVINSKRKDQLKTKEDVPVTEAFELYMLKNFHQIELNPLTTKMLNFWEKDFEQSIEKHKKFLQENLENQENYATRFSQILDEMDIFQSEEDEEKKRKIKIKDKTIPQMMIKTMIKKIIKMRTMIKKLKPV